MSRPDFPLINGEAYSWASIKAEVLGSLVFGITAINYGEKENKENKYGIGRVPIARGYGNVETNASISLYKDTLEALQKIAPNGKIHDIPPFDLTVAYINKNGKYTKDVPKNWEFTENKVESNQGDTGIIVSIECIISDVDWGR